MEQERIQLEPSQTYHLTPEELRQAYIYLGLVIYDRHRAPNYSEGLLLKLLRHDFNKYQTEIQTLMKEYPNNHILHRLQYFFASHNKYLKRIQNNDF